MSLDSLLQELRREAGWENTLGAIAAARKIAALPGDAPVLRMIDGLAAVDRINLDDDAGDVGDEVHRLRVAYREGLVACGPTKAIPHLRPLVGLELREYRHTVMIQVLAQLGDQSIVPIVTEWSADSEPTRFLARMASIHALSFLRPPETSRLLRAVLARPGTENPGWLKRYTARALGQIGDLEALEVLLDDDDWYVRLGVAEAVKELSGEHAERLRKRLKADVDPRVREA